MSALDQILAFEFDNDEEFMAGVQSILSNQPQATAEERDALVTKAKVFYFNRKTGSNIDLEEYIRKVQEGHEQQTPMDGDTKDSPSAPSGTTDPATAASTEEGGGSEINIKTLTFAEIKHLIETGQTHLIPNNKIIPDELNESPPSVSVAQVKKKPWEIAASTSSDAN